MAGKKQLPPAWEEEPGDAPQDDGNKPMKLMEAIGSGSRLDELRALRWIVSQHLASPTTLPRDLAALIRQQREISKEIEELESASKPDALDEAADTDDARFDPGEI